MMHSSDFVNQFGRHTEMDTTATIRGRLIMVRNKNGTYSVHVKQSVENYNDDLCQKIIHKKTVQRVKCEK